MLRVQRKGPPGNSRFPGWNPYDMSISNWMLRPSEFLSRRISIRSLPAASSSIASAGSSDLKPEILNRNIKTGLFHQKMLLI
jgi:hypothetical protein